MANELKFGNKVVFLNGLPLTLPIAASDPGSPSTGDLYYNSTSNTVRYYNGSVWGAVSNNSLTGLSLSQNSIIVGNGSNLSAAVSTSGSGHILADSSTALTIKNDVITNAHINSSAAIAYSKLAALTANRALQSDGSGVVSISSVTATELGYVSGVTSAIQTQLNNRALDSAVIKKDGSVPFTGNQSLGGNKITNSADPTAASDLATKAYVDAVAEGLRPKAAVRVATLVAGTLATSFEDGDTIDGVVLATGDRILIKNQASPAQNGIYVVQASGAPVRATDFDSLSPIDEINGAYTFIQEGTQAGQGWVETGAVAVIGTDPINFVYFNSVGTIIGGDMITVTGSTISVDLASVSGLESSNPGNNAGQLRIKLEASNPSLKITGSNELGVKLDSAGAITSGASGLIVGVDGSTLEISSNALRVKALGISNSHIATSAAIALSKLAAVTANKALASDSSGFIVATSVTDTELGYVSGVTSAIQTQLNGKASTTLNNLGTTALNADILPASDLARALGSASLRFTNVFASAIDGGASALTLKTTASNASVIINAHGTGNLDIEATKVRRSANGADTSNFMEDQYHDALTLSSNISSPTAITALSFAVASFDGAIINYKIKEATSGKVRTGQFIVASDGTIASSSDQFSESATLGSALGLALTSDISGGNIRILYNNTHASNAATMHAHVRRLRA